MPRFQLKNLSKEEQEKLLSEFFVSIAVLENVQEVGRFFKDLLSVSETTMLARRLKVAKMLEQNYTFDQISAYLKVGKATIANIQRWLDYGRDGYRTALQKLSKQENKIIKRRLKEIKRLDISSFTYLKNKYKAYHVLEKFIPEMAEEINKLWKKYQKKKSVQRLLKKKG